MAARDLRSTDAKQKLSAIMTQWLPLTKSLLNMVVKNLPSPAEIKDERAEQLMCSKAARFDTLPAQTQALKGTVDYFAYFLRRILSQKMTIFQGGIGQISCGISRISSINGLISSRNSQISSRNSQTSSKKVKFQAEIVELHAKTVKFQA